MDMQPPQQDQEPSREPRKIRPSSPPLEIGAPNKMSLANQVCWIMGAVFVLGGLLGFVTPGLFSAHLNPTHNVIFLISGILSLWMGLGKANFVAKRFSYWLGGFYAVLGVAGFIFGQLALSVTRPTISGAPEESRFLWKIIPGTFELGTADHILHLVIAAVFVIGAYFTLRKESGKITWH